MARGRKTGGRQKGTPNKASAPRQADVAAQGDTLLQVVIDYRRGVGLWLHDVVARTDRGIMSRQALDRVIRRHAYDR
jgi:hypothetical protein